MTELTCRTIILWCAMQFCRVLMLAFIIAFPTSAFAGNGILPQETTSEKRKTETDYQAPRVLLTHSGLLAEGKIDETPVGYIVKKGHSTILIPASQVLHVAQNRTGIYELLRKGQPNATVKQHLILARWCITNQLYPHAEKELYDILKIEPGQVAARKMLLRLKTITNPKSSSYQSKPKKKFKVDAALFVQDVRSLAGLSRENATLFSRKVQPILVNKCSNAGCHAKTSNSQFKLNPIRSGRGSHRVFAEQNLAAIFKQINFEEPRHSPLITKTTGGHGKNGNTLFHGRAGKKQREILIKWITSVASGQAAPTGKFEAKVTSTKKQITPASFDSNQIPIKQTEESKKQKLFKRIIQESENDAFNPNDFNQQSTP